MKLRYYLRGLGVGILLATILLTIANRDNQPMTDAEVRTRAAELGMVESGSVRLSELTSVEAEESTAETTQAQESSAEESAESTAETSTETEEAQESSSAESAESTAETTHESSETESTAMESSSAAESEKQETAAETKTGETVTFEIHSGASSDTVSRNLAAAGLVTDASAFDTYLCDNGYSRRIRVGTYEIPVGSTEAEIAEIITGN